ncbi:MAG: aminopeptidase [Thermoplasmata archaeon]|nr:aminopeptidase [Thermoplasmata archaeon]
MATDGAATASLAKSLLGGALHVRAGENVVIETWNHTLDYARACVVEARRIGARPILWLEDEPAYWRSIEEAPAVKGWAKPGEHEWAALTHSNAYVFFPGPADRPRLVQQPAKRTEELLAYNGEWYRRAKKARLRGVRSVLGYASDAQAERWGVSGITWRDQLVRAATEVDLGVIHTEAKRAAQKLKTGSMLRITSPNGTDVTLKLRKRTPWVDDGSVTAEDLAIGANMTVSPPGTVLVAVDEKSAEGIAIANRPSYLRAGRVEGGQWEAKAGKVSNIWYTEGQAEFDAAFQAAPKGKDIVSIFSVGLNPSLDPGVPQVEDQEAGAVTLGIGGNEAYGGSNKCPFLSWIVIGEATVAVDGKPLCDRGKLL